MIDPATFKPLCGYVTCACGEIFQVLTTEQQPMLDENYQQMRDPESGELMFEDVPVLDQDATGAEYYAHQPVCPGVPPAPGPDDSGE